MASCTSMSCSPLLPLLLEERHKVIAFERIEHVCLGEPALARDADAVGDVAEPARAVRVGADRDADAALGGAPMIAPVQIEAVRIGVQLDADAQLARALDHHVEVRIVPRAL